ncbi:MAG: LysR family transcriptional regulator [Eubacteriales bacterium]|nr:LysR family transcriptional regulator [Eubacteriales bacterium]
MEQNLNSYHIFYEVAKCGNISKAADALYISQPAVSKSITRLEQSLNHQLFIRSKKGVKLTEEGQTLYQHLQTAFAAIDAAEQDLYRISHFGMGQLRIGVSTSLCKHILLPYLQDFIDANPHIKVSIECNPTFETIELLKQDKIDIGLVCDTDFQKGYHYTPLRSIHDTFVTTQTYLDNLALRETNLSKDINVNADEEDLSLPTMTGLFMFSNTESAPSNIPSLSEKEILEKANLMLLDKENISRIYIDQYFNEHHIQPSQLLEINNMDLLIDFAAIGMGVACVVREFVSNYIESGQVIEIPIDYTIPARSVGFLYKENTLSLTAEKFLDYAI